MILDRATRDLAPPASLDRLDRTLSRLGQAGLPDAAEQVRAIDAAVERLELLWARAPAKVAQRFVHHVVVGLDRGAEPDQAAWDAIEFVQEDAARDDELAALNDELSRHPTLFPDRPKAHVPSPHERRQAIPARPTTREKVPTRPAERTRWRTVWRLIKGRAEFGENAEEIEGWLKAKYCDLRHPSLKTLGRIIRAGREGLLDDNRPG